MSTPTMNHSSHTHQQEQQQQINEIQDAHLNSTNLSQTILTRSDSTSTVILEEEETPKRRRKTVQIHPPSLLPNHSIQLLSFLKTSGLFNKDWESSDRLSELLASGNEFTLPKLLSEVGGNDFNFDMNELMKFDSIRLDSRTLSEFLRSESFDQLIASANNNNNNNNNSPNPLAIPCLSSSFSELRPLSPELTTNTNYNEQSDQVKMESDDSFQYTRMTSFDYSTPSMNADQINQNQGALNAFEHDHAFLSKRTEVDDVPTSSNSKQTNKSQRTSSRIQSRRRCSTQTEVSSTKTKRAPNIKRAKDIQTSDDLSYYLERRRKNNEASKNSRAARKQKFGDMDQRCAEYERVNGELRNKITVLETVTSTLKTGLVNNFQRKN